MLVFYSGWGYWEWYEEESGDNEVIKIQQHSSPLHACDLFELPKNSEKEIKYLGQTATKYLTPSNFTEEYYPSIPNAVFDNEDNAPKFILCEPWEYNYFKQAHEQEEPINISVTFTEKDIQTPPTDSEKLKNLTEKERNTMLKLIIGMAIDAYDYDPQAKRNKATGDNRGSIKAALESHGIVIDADTIRKYLSEAKELIELKDQ